jgi:GNAT superfamily N-acetyltransferase
LNNTASQITIVQAGPEQSEAALTLLARFFVEEGFETPADQLQVNLLGMVEEPTCRVTLAWRNGVPIGLATMSMVRSTEFGLISEIQDLYVRPEARSSGVARALVTDALAWSSARGCSALEVYITPEGEAQHGLSRFYARLGFIATGRTVHVHDLA